MGTPNILLTRIDNRLVHGQVGVTWTTSLGANLLLVADDEIVKDPLQQQLMAVTAETSGAQIRFFTVEHTVNVIHKASANQKIFIICRTPGEVRRLVAGGVPIKEVNVGNMHFVQGKWPLSKKVYVDDTDVQDLKYLLEQGVSVFIQDTPGDIKKYI
ncbi:PTS galactosamine transporter subunit IIB [Propionispora vibrioides]|jgi:PTS system galactosamine-specific IIB component|uniref:PTS system D-galactosamine-specific EIIB component, Man family n=1 Tax=Propionispora vibrioides TaxID=112903 RepID=A0A1H8W813_9FIRM|nr:PTS galactosamine transporter subunit IIB [Propionispora vibrioides]SEP23663.1 PTS system D-galactosamine-specific EIIB component, Man family [Propionispora vibrioides]